MKRMFLKAGCFFTLCSMSITLAGETDNEKRKGKKSDAKIDIAVIKVQEGNEGRGDKDAVRQEIVIAINGDTQEVELGKDTNEASEEIMNVIIAADDERRMKGAIFGQGMIIGPNGEKKKFKLGSSDESKIVFEGLPEEVSEQLKKVMNDADKRAALRQILMIGPDGVPKSIEMDIDVEMGVGHPDAIERLNLEDGARAFFEQAVKGITIQGIGEFAEASEDSKGRLIIMAPDGKPEEIAFDIEEMAEALADAFSSENQSSPEILGKIPLLQFKTQKGKKKSGGKGNGNSVSDKLDLILKRLEQIEKRVQDLENS